MGGRQNGKGRKGMKGEEKRNDRLYARKGGRDIKQFFQNQIP